MKKEIVMELLSEVMSATEDKEKSSQNGTLKICILQRGWVFVGNYYEDGEDCRLENASCIRDWGTTKGLGEIAEGGPTSSTKLDPVPTVRFHKLGIVATIDCNEKKWK